ncbi:radical SAM family heme chaperone HemW [Metabacillus arenae]|uniref:Heme chaperone HemW n=1 Tax=Metabacillus arenae TaxID=2771434 RepID=A0A926ND67_9BACI|nr:radical SAM family heme chaperone HemW [Metabacillus arenae]MBD1382087.1 oxygen-independent coproporphyrinogen III oxidase [Metabacillus arenae]
MIKSAYIHIPFCEHICHYCDFNKIFIQNQPVDQYLSYLQKEMRNTIEINPIDSLKTIFIGGGTPTALNERELGTLMEIIHSELPLTKELIEFAVEANPGDLTKEKFLILKKAGVNRLSFGVQSFHNERLKMIGRTHRKSDVIRSIQLAKEIGFENISIDLMYALPGQTLEEFKETLDEAFSHNVQHYSAYSLIVEPKTVFYNLMRKGKLSLPPQEEEALMYEYLMESMEEHGFHQYEISNFSLQGFESKHNLTYWNNEDYFGFGAGAHSYMNGRRCANAGPLKKYFQEINDKGVPYINVHHVTKHERMEEEIFLGLRKTNGISKAIFKKKFGVNIEDVFAEQIQEQIERGLLVNKGEQLCLTHQGKLLGNEVFQTFIGVLESVD